MQNDKKFNACIGLILLGLTACAAPPLEERKPGISEDQYNLIVQKCELEGAKSPVMDSLMRDYLVGNIESKCVSFEQSKALAEGKNYRP
jgi:hypothetical protein